MTRRLSSSTRSHTEDSIFLRPDEDPVWLDEPTKTEKIGDGALKKDGLLECKDGTTEGQNPQEEVFFRKVYTLVIELHCWAALFITSQILVCVPGSLLSAFNQSKFLGRLWVSAAISALQMTRQHLSLRFSFSLTFNFPQWFIFSYV